MKFLPSRGHRDILPFIQNWVLPNSVVYTDCLSSYAVLPTLGYSHRTVTHFREFANSEGYSTNTIEGLFWLCEKIFKKPSYKYVDHQSLNIF